MLKFSSFDNVASGFCAFELFPWLVIPGLSFSGIYSSNGSKTPRQGLRDGLWVGRLDRVGAARPAFGFQGWLETLARPGSSHLPLLPGLAGAAVSSFLPARPLHRVAAPSRLVLDAAD